jgi:tellurite resistance protein
MNLRTPFALAALAFATVSAFAQTPAASAATPRVDARQANQEKRIEQGVNSGQLTARETLRLEREQKHVATAEAKADGTVTPAERKHLHKMQNAASKDIAHQKHDAQTAAAPAPAPK